MPKALMIKIFSLLFPIFASLLSAVLLVLAFPKYELEWLAWVGLVPLLLGIYGRSPKFGFVLSYVWGLIFFAVVFAFVLKVPGYTPLHHALLDLYLGAFYGLFGWSYSYISRRWGGPPAAFAAPFVWVSLEYVRANFGFLAFPWVLLAHSQYQVPHTIQMSSMTGAYGVSFLIVMVNSALAAVVMLVAHEIRKNQSSFYRPISKRGVVAVAATAALLTSLFFFHGLVIVSKSLVGERIKVAVVQGNMDQGIIKWRRKYAKFIMDTYADLTREASKDQPALIVWPESATPQSIRKNDRLYALVRRIAETAGTCLLIGSTQHQKFGAKNRMEVKYSNSAFLINPHGSGESQRYDKIRLFPFGEYLPMKETIPWSWIRVPNLYNITPGTEFTVFEVPGFRFGVTICWETVFPGLIREFVKGGAQSIVNITNEASFGETAAPYHMVATSVFRAVENRIYVVRCANTGISCFIDPYGRIIDRVRDVSGKDIFVRGVLTETIIPMDSETIYTRYGDWFVWLCLAASTAFLVLAFLRKNPDRHSQ